jgi:hypothetical protein
VKSIYGNTSHALFDQDLPFSIKFYEEPKQEAIGASGQWLLGK